MSFRLLVVGGGIAGIVAALRARADGLAVTLVERESGLGGLLTSLRFDGAGEWFDQGTHLPAATGELELDRILFGDLPPDEWQTLPVLKAGTFWNGRLKSDSACLDLRSLPPDRYAAVLPGLLAESAPPCPEPASLAAQLAASHGPAMVTEVFSPVLEKFYAASPDELAPDAHLLFGLGRFICLDAARTRELKRNSALDRKLSYHSYRETPPSVRSGAAYYPREGGAGRWIDRLAARLQASGVEIRTNCRLESIDPAAGTAVTTAGQRLEFDHLAWSLPAGQLLRLAGHPAATQLVPPRLAAITLLHYVTHAKPLTDAYYVTCFDAALRTFRVTFYSNLQPVAGPVRLTVEVLRPRPGELSPSAESIFAELKQTGLLPATAAYEQVHTQEIAAGFPIQTNEHRAGNARAAALVDGTWPGVRLLGRASGTCFFMRDVLRDAWRPAAWSNPALSR